MINVVRDFSSVSVNTRCFGNMTELHSAVSNLKFDDEFLLSKQNIINKIIEINPVSESYCITLTKEVYSIITLKSFDNNLSEATIDLGLMQSYVKALDVCSALLFYIEKIKEIQISPQESMKIFNEDMIAFHSYFHVFHDETKYYGIVDNEYAHLPQHVASIKTENFLKFLEALLELNKNGV